MTAALRYYMLVDGHPTPCDLLTWGRWLEKQPKESIIKETQIGAIRIATIFLGYDHNWSGTGLPLLIETMIFGGELDGEQWRYATQAAAVMHHEELCARVRGKG